MAISMALNKENFLAKLNFLLLCLRKVGMHTIESGQELILNSIKLIKLVNNNMDLNGEYIGL